MPAKTFDWEAGFATLVLTSCDRPTQLETTLTSILKCDLSGLKRFIVIEDSSNPQIAEIVERVLVDVPHLFLQNPVNLGQIRSIDRAYAEVDTTYIYHCEEDWYFPTSLYIHEGRRILDANPNVSVVLARKLADYKMQTLHPEILETDGIPFLKANPKWNWKWGSFSFNPGMRRTEDYLAIGSYAQLGPEQEISMHLKFQGKVVVFLRDGDIAHTGHVSTAKPDEKKLHRKKGYLLHKAKRKIQFAWFCLMK